MSTTDRTIIGSWSEEKTRLRAVKESSLGHLSSLRARRPALTATILLAAVALLAIGGDAYTTLAMMASGHFEEANGVAAVGMALLTPLGYTLLASLVSLGMASLVLLRGPGLLGRALPLAGLVFILLKLYTAGSNLYLWLS